MEPKIFTSPEGQVGLRFQDNQELVLDFLNDKSSYDRPLPKGKNELIAKALGVAKGWLHVVDATAGLGQDALVMARLGCEVRSLERSKLLFIILQDALSRAQKDLHHKHHEAFARLQFIQANAIDWLRGLPSIDWPDVVYMDPMFPEKKKSALPRKEMVLFRQLVGSDEDAVELFAQAKRVARHRVVVKRPLRAPDLAPAVLHRFEGNSVRYDIYASENV